MKTEKDLEYSYKHLNKRLIERYNIQIERKEYEKLNEKIKTDGKSSLMLIENKNQELHRLIFRGKTIVFVFDTKRKCVTTAILI